MKTTTHHLIANLAVLFLLVGMYLVVSTMEYRSLQQACTGASWEAAQQLHCEGVATLGTDR